MKTSVFSISLKRGKTSLKPWNRVALFFYHVPLDLPLVWFNDRSGSPECPSVSRQPWHRDERWNGDCDWCNYAASDWRRGQIITGLIGLCLDWAYATLWLKCCRKVCVCVCVGQLTGFKQRKEKKYLFDLPTRLIQRMLQFFYGT